jgi:hypothetical protein
MALYVQTNILCRQEPKATTEVHVVLNLVLKPPNIATIMAKNFLWPFVVIAGLSLANPNYVETQMKTLTPEVTQLEWDGWSVKIDAVNFSSVVEHYGTEKGSPNRVAS